MNATKITPRATEKAYNAEAQSTYVFYVDKGMSKQAIARAVADEYKVTVIDVRVLTRKGKPTRFSRGKHAYPGTTNRADQKIAYVALKSGDKIPVFEVEDKAGDKATDTTKEAAEAPKDPKVAKAEAKEAKKAEKAAAKEAKKAAKSDKEEK